MDDANFVEVSFLGGKVLVTFADGMMALLEPGLIRRLAVEAGSLKPLPKSPLTQTDQSPARTILL
jgi:hypothetical protein